MEDTKNITRKKSPPGRGEDWDYLLGYLGMALLGFSILASSLMGTFSPENAFGVVILVIGAGLFYAKREFEQDSSLKPDVSKLSSATHFTEIIVGMSAAAGFFYSGFTPFGLNGYVLPLGLLLIREVHLLVISPIISDY